MNHMLEVCPACLGHKLVMKPVCDDPLYCPVVECPTCGGKGTVKPAVPEMRYRCSACAELLIACEIVLALYDECRASGKALTWKGELVDAMREAVRKARGD